MIALLQRVSEARVVVNNKMIGEIQRGLLVFIGIEKKDNLELVARLVDKVLSYRVFPDKEDKMNLSVLDIQGGLLLVPQFTLAADTQNGCRPSFSSAAAPELGKILFDEFVKTAKNKYQYVETGEFGADMKVSLLNDGPVTFWLQV
jgi:D-tyrosyl-tRNA(Tyr) deacylase